MNPRVTPGMPSAAVGGGVPPKYRGSLAYYPPWLSIIPAVVCMGLMTYLATCKEVDESGQHLVEPLHLKARIAKHRVQRDTNAASFDFVLFLDKYLMDEIFELGKKLFGGMEGIRLVCWAAWIIHLLEAAKAIQVLRPLPVRSHVAMTYVIGTILGGMTQLLPLMKARDKLLAANY